METGPHIDPTQIDMPQIETEKPKNNVDELWNSSLRDIVNYTYDSGSNHRNEEIEHRKKLYPKELDYLTSFGGYLLPITDYEGKSQRDFQKETIHSLLSKNPEFKDIYRQALEYRIEHDMSPEIPIGVAMRMLKRDSHLNVWSGSETKALRDTLKDPVRKNEFIYVLENYIRPETWPQRYNTIANILEERGVGINQDAEMLDIGSSSGQALTSLSETRFPKLKIIALDRLPTKLLDLYFPLEQDQGNVERRMGDTLNLEVPDNSVDLVNFSYIFMHLPEDKCKQALNEAFRVLKVGGLIFIQGFKQGSFEGGTGFYGHKYEAWAYGERDRDKVHSDFDGVVLCKKDENTLEEQLVYGRETI